MELSRVSAYSIKPYDFPEKAEMFRPILEDFDEVHKILESKLSFGKREILLIKKRTAFQMMRDYAGYGNNLMVQKLFLNNPLTIDDVNIIFRGYSKKKKQAILQKYAEIKVNLF